jgi:group II intron reverse transcriptase/maturase
VVSRQKTGRSGTDNSEHEQLAFALEEEGEAYPEPAQGSKPSAAADPMRTLTQRLMEQVADAGNMRHALKRVKENHGSAGVDGRTVGELPDYLRTHWPRIRQELLEGTYQPHPVKRVAMPRPDGGVRLLGIPTVVDRLVQQALLQILDPLYDPTFSPSSYGFRSGKSARMAVSSAKKHMAEGNGWVVDLDLERFFDRVNHDILMGRLARRIGDGRILLLIRRYLEAGVLLNGVVVASEEGAPQGGPLSPLLANILLDDLDKELERQGHRFCGYADDCNIYVRSRRAGERTLASVTRFLETKLKLTVKRAKSAVDRPARREFPGFTLARHKGEVRQWIAQEQEADDGACSRHHQAQPGHQPGPDAFRIEGFHERMGCLLLARSHSVRVPVSRFVDSPPPSLFPVEAVEAVAGPCEAVGQSGSRSLAGLWGGVQRIRTLAYRRHSGHDQRPHQCNAQIAGPCQPA